ncbi:MAG TPA: DNA repair protein RecO [bacterium]|nr:DNA repair protein RecO [bacterium]HPT29916.1 DNA repair protein RecO [bacterium]
MEETYSTPAIVLKREAHREFDGRVLVYSPQKGKLDLVARGMLRPSSKLAAHLEPITLINLMVIRGKNRHYVGSAINVDAYSGIKSDLNKVYYSGLGFNLFNRLVHLEHADGELFTLLISFLQAMEKTADPEWLLQAFSLKLIALLGYQPDLYHCAHCQQELVAGANHFKSEGGEIVCVHCRPEREAGIVVALSDGAIKVMRLILSEDSPFLEKFQLPEEIRLEIIGIIPKIVEYSVF